MPQLTRRFVAQMPRPVALVKLGRPWACGCGRKDNAANASNCQGCGRPWSSSS